MKTRFSERICLLFPSNHISMSEIDLELKQQGYTLGVILGEGSYAKVRGSFSEKLQMRVAIKIINKKRAPRDFREKFLPRELAVFKTVSHPNIIQMFEILEIGSKIYIVMEHAGHGDLLEFIKLRGALSFDMARTMFVQTATAVEYLHKKHIVHRDLKCENLLLDSRNVIKVSDFGFSRFFEPGDKIRTYCGSAAYAAPEILQGIPYDAPCHDTWSLGVILFIMVCASMPFDDSNLKQMIRDQKDGRLHFPRAKKLPGLLKELILGILEADVEKRLCIPEMMNHPWIHNDSQNTTCAIPGSANTDLAEASSAKLKPSSNTSSSKSSSINSDIPNTIKTKSSNTKCNDSNVPCARATNTNNAKANVAGASTKAATAKLISSHEGSASTSPEMRNKL
ncbi:testis-specific serine/threonine-protein kinase 2-like [Gigantopelta aegis]|uniref:testis-specific serine/threonine-protein kinase 2-like n=1 Tax=Gigantopelta aegis TaxID=1735272 RepID=UPI001B887E78|nr:testis-specific serine/threonine-protein kinase 2-like [Gigantopelta aegis]